MKVISFILSALAGVVLGAVIAVYFKVRAIRKRINGKIDKTAFSNSDGLGRKKVEEIVSGYKRQFKRQTRGNILRAVIGIKQKQAKGLPVLLKEEVLSVADAFGCENRKNLLNFSIKSAFDFAYKVTLRLEEIIKDIDLSPLKTVDISSMVGIAKKTRAVYTGTVKRATGAYFIACRIMNAINPVFWIKQVILKTFTALVMRELVFACIEITAWEFAFFYGKENF